MSERSAFFSPAASFDERRQSRERESCRCRKSRRTRGRERPLRGRNWHHFRPYLRISLSVSKLMNTLEGLMALKREIDQARARRKRGEVGFFLMPPATSTSASEEKNSTTYLFGRPPALGALPRRSRNFPVRADVKMCVRCGEQVRSLEASTRDVF